MLTAWVAPVGAVVAVGVVLLPPLPYLPEAEEVAVGEAVLLVAVGDDGEAEVDELLPQAAKSTRTPKIRRQNMVNVMGLVLFMCLFIVPLFRK